MFTSTHKKCSLNEILIVIENKIISDYIDTKQIKYCICCFCSPGIKHLLNCYNFHDFRKPMYDCFYSNILPLQPKVIPSAICGICQKGKQSNKKGKPEALIHCSQCDNSGKFTHLKNSFLHYFYVFVFSSISN